MDIDWEKLIIAGTFVVIVGMLAIIGWATYKDEKAWSRYSVEHHCKAVGTKVGTTSVGVGGDGKVMTVTSPDQTIYRCDNGEIFIR